MHFNLRILVYFQQFFDASASYGGRLETADYCPFENDISSVSDFFIQYNVSTTFMPTN